MTWTAPQIDRTELAYVGDERTVLDRYLDWHRQTLLSKCAGLNAEQLKIASAEPSNLTLLGLVRHMAEVERWWFRVRSAGQAEHPIYCTDESPDGDFDDVADADAEADFATFRGRVRGRPELAAADCRWSHVFVHARTAARDEPALGLRTHDRGVRPAQRPRRPDPGTHRRRDRRLSRILRSWHDARSSRRRRPCKVTRRRRRSRCPLPVLDSHTHLDIVGGDPADQIAAANAVGVDRLVQVGVDVESSRLGRGAGRASTPAVLATVALHPNEAPRLADLDEALREIESLAAQPRVRGIGETGLDHLPHRRRRPGARRSTAFGRTSRSPSGTASRS